MSRHGDGIRNYDENRPIKTDKSMTAPIFSKTTKIQQNGRIKRLNGLYLVTNPFKHIVLISQHVYITNV